MMTTYACLQIGDRGDPNEGVIRFLQRLSLDIADQLGL
jgi:hypothetical protein